MFVKYHLRSALSCCKTLKWWLNMYSEKSLMRSVCCIAASKIQEIEYDCVLIALLVSII